MTINESIITDIREFKNKLIADRALSAQQLAIANKTKETIKEMFSRMKEEDIALLESRGIYVRNLLSFDLDLVIKDQDYKDKYMAELIKVINQIKDYLNSKRRV